MGYLKVSTKIIRATDEIIKIKILFNILKLFLISVFFLLI